MKIIARNKRASYEFSLLETIEAGIALQGTEVKALRNGKANITDAYVTIDSHQEAWIFNMQIPQYEFGNRENHKESRKRKLLLHREEITKIVHAMQTRGLTIVALKLYFKRSRVKLELALAKGKKNYDKRQDERKKEDERKIRQQMKEIH